MQDLTPDAIKTLPTLTRKRVEVPEWGGAVYIQEMTAARREEYDASMWLNNDDASSNSNRFRLLLVAACICTEDGGELFTYDQLAQQKDSIVVETLYDIAQEINATGEKGVEAEAKN